MNQNWGPLNRYKPDLNKIISQELSEKNEKWLTNAINKGQYSEIIDIKSALELLSNYSVLKDDRLQQNILEQIQELSDSADLGKIFSQFSGFPILLQIILNTKNLKIRKIGCSLLTNANQNNANSQQITIARGGFYLINLILNEKDQKLKEVEFTCLSSIIRGEFLQGKRDFIEIDGIELLMKLLNSPYEKQKIKDKSLFLLQDLTYYDNNLNLVSIKDLQNQINPEQKQQKTKDQLALYRYKNIVKNKLMTQNFVLLQNIILDNKEPENTQFRASYIYTLNALVQFNKKLTSNVNIRYLKDHFELLMKQNKLHDGVYDYEINVLQEMIKAI